MRKELDDKLCIKYPRIFANRNKTKYESPFYYGFEHGDGWFDLLDQLCDCIQDYLDRNPTVPQVVVNQVKEKFGTLNFYVSGGDDTTRAMISQAGKDSENICESCGSNDRVTNTKGWIKYLCVDCMEEHLKKIK